MADGQDSLSDDTASKKGGKARRELPAGAVATLKAWLLSPEHFTHPYPTPQDQIMLMQKTGIDKKQLKNWFTNARRRIWKPMLKKQLEQGKIQQTGNGGVVTMTTNPGLLNIVDSATDYSVGGSMGDPTQVMPQSYQQSSQQQEQQSQYDLYGNTTYLQQQASQQQTSQYGNTNYFSQVQGQYNQNDAMGTSNSIGSLPPIGMSNSTTNLNKTDSHAVLMELFTRDQDLVRRQKEFAALQAQSGAAASNTQNQGGGSQHPMSSKISGGSSTLNKLGNVPSMNSWPHFSSVSSLNNLGTMTGVKSITNMSGADLVSQGSLNKKGNLAQVKSIENMGRADSYAFLEVFFDNPGTTQSQRGMKREREEDDNVGLSLDGDEGSSPMATMQGSSSMDHMKSSSAPVPAPLPLDGQDKEGLKRAYDDALAARGLISVSRSSEKLTDLVLPVKMQRTISQEYLKSMNSGNSTTFTTFSFNSNIPQPVTSVPSQGMDNINGRHTGGTQHLQQQPLQTSQHSYEDTLTNDNFNDSVEVPFSTKCALCQQTKVDTQLRPCGHLFHGNCVKNSIQNAIGAPRCPIDNITMVSAILAVPTVDNANSNTTTYNGSASQGKQ